MDSNDVDVGPSWISMQSHEIVSNELQSELSGQRLDGLLDFYNKA